MKHLRLIIEDGVAILTLNNPPQNRIGTPMLEDLEESAEIALTKGEKRPVLQFKGR